jgi:hypothetical protein
MMFETIGGDLPPQTVTKTSSPVLLTLKNWNWHPYDLYRDRPAHVT